MRRSAGAQGLHPVPVRGERLRPVVRSRYTDWRLGRVAAQPVRPPGMGPRLHAPSRIEPVPILGGHADYFREAAPFVHPDGRSNLDRTAAAVRNWLAL
ncbi:hypothetical protein LJK87_26065 [Paenibacillus sp. P25]|nr:hypothetical protein LJK87_26065 [Paenibacillus sp. P25]